MLKTIPVQLKENSYEIKIGHGCFKKILKYLNPLKLGNYGIVIVSSKVYDLYKNLIKNTFKAKDFKIIKVINGEKLKSRKWLFHVINEILKTDTWGRKIFILCLGGGTVGDLGGFVASMYKRGVPYLHIPTTLLAQIDASIGGKTAIDLNEAKNILGSFYQPKTVIIDPNFLTTLSKKELKQGIAEAIKYGLIIDEDFFYFLKKNHKRIEDLDPASISKLIHTCASIKAKIVEKDEKEIKGLRTILNFGHTLGHALESSLKYQKISHGEAIAIGMIFATKLSYFLGKCDKNVVNEVIEMIKLFKIPTKINFDYISLYKSLTYDKKFVSGKIRMVLIKKIGEVEVVEGISPEKIKKILKTFSI